MFKRLRNRWSLWLLGAAGLAHLLMMGSLFWGYFDSLAWPSERSTQAVDFFSIYEAGHSVIENRSLYEYAGLWTQQRQPPTSRRIDTFLSSPTPSARP